MIKCHCEKFYYRNKKRFSLAKVKKTIIFYNLIEKNN